MDNTNLDNTNISDNNVINTNINNTDIENPAPKFSMAFANTVIYTELIIIILNIIFMASIPKTSGMDGLAYLMVPLYSSALIIIIDVITLIYSIFKIVSFSKRGMVIPGKIKFLMYFSLKMFSLYLLGIIFNAASFLRHLFQ